jgi:hypothetical protein
MHLPEQRHQSQITNYGLSHQGWHALDPFAMWQGDNLEDIPQFEYHTYYLDINEGANRQRRGVLEV